MLLIYMIMLYYLLLTFQVLRTTERVHQVILSQFLRCL